jgi:hypothetical protein
VVTDGNHELSRTANGLGPWRFLILVVLILAGIGYAVGDSDPCWTSDADLMVLSGVVALGSATMTVTAAD